MLIEFLGLASEQVNKAEVEIDVTRRLLSTVEAAWASFQASTTTQLQDIMEESSTAVHAQIKLESMKIKVTELTHEMSRLENQVSCSRVS